MGNLGDKIKLQQKIQKGQTGAMFNKKVKKGMCGCGAKISGMNPGQQAGHLARCNGKP